jgi:predicted AlkP superfamily phosphohydrolase/phosphomutase
MSRLLLIGLDCLGAELLAAEQAEVMPRLSALAGSGLSGALQSTQPPITVPAWTSMLTGRDPGELGVYGFRNRRSFQYGDLVRATSGAVRYPRVWDRMTRAGRPSIVVGVPQTSPPPRIDGAVVCGFEGALDGDGYTWPLALADEVEQVVGEYEFDVQEYRHAPLDQVRETARRMTEKRFRLMRHLLASRRWEFAMLHEIGADRMHHCFWSYHDPAHPRHDRSSPYVSAVRDYYRYLDAHVGSLLDMVGSGTSVLVASDHGATAMHGGVCVNELLRGAGLLTLRDEPGRPRSLEPGMVDWSATQAWAEGGYYARVFFNVAGREPLGIVEPTETGKLAARIQDLLGTVPLGDGRVLHNQVCTPAELYRRVRGIAPDLMVFFDSEHWRSIGSVGHRSRWVSANDTGVDEANHARDGLYILRAPGAPSGVTRRASILDVTPTLVELLGLPEDPELPGRSLLRIPDSAGVLA